MAGFSTNDRIKGSPFQTCRVKGTVQRGELPPPFESPLLKCGTFSRGGVSGGGKGGRQGGGSERTRTRANARRRKGQRECGLVPHGWTFLRLSMSGKLFFGLLLFCWCECPTFAFWAPGGLCELVQLLCWISWGW